MVRFKDFLWLLTGAAWLPIYAATQLTHHDPKWLRWWGNRVDNLPDAAKEWLHCHRLPFGKQLNLAFMMKNRGKPYWPIVRKWGYYENCDPEDLEREKIS